MTLGFLGISIVGNIILDYLFVGVWSWGIRGAAIATCMAQTVSVVFAFIYMRWKHRDLLFSREDMCIDGSMVRRTLYFGMVSMLHQVSLYFGKILVQGAVNMLGVFAISAFTATTRIEGFINSFSTSVGQAMTIVIAQNLGGGNRERVKECLKKGMQMLIALGIVLSVVMFAGAGGFLKLLNGNMEAAELQAGILYLRWVAVFYIFNYVGSAFVGYFRGIGRVEVAFKGTILQMSFRIVLSFLLIRKISLAAVAIGTGIGWIAIVIYQFLTYKRLHKQKVFSILSA